MIYAPPAQVNRTPIGGIPSTSFAAAQSQGRQPIEIPSLDTANSSTVREPNGTYTTMLYPVPIHYRDAQGNWANIQNTLVPSSVSGYADQNEANSYRLLLPPNLSTPIKVEDGTASIAFALQGAGASTLSTSGNTGTYASVLPGADLQYTAGNGMVKESFTIADAAAAANLSSLSFSLQTDGVTPQTNSQGGITFTNAAGQALFSFAPPIMYSQSTPDQTGPVTMQLTPQGSGNYTVTLTPDQQWLQASGRAYPVILDPTVNFVGASQDNFLLQNYPTTNYGGVSYINAGVGVGALRPVLQFNVSSIPSQAQVLDARLSLYNYANSTGTATPLEVHALTHSWTMYGSTWNTYDGTNAWTNPGGDFNATPAATTNGLGVTTGWDYWDPTALVQGWVDGTIPNDGLIIKEPTENVTNIIHFYSTSYTNSSYWPTLTVNYELRLGKQPYYTMPSHSLTPSENLGVNVFNGNLNFDLTALSIKGTGLNETLDFNYNSLSNHTYDLGYGWFTQGDTGLWTFLDGSVAYYDSSSYIVPFIKNADGSFTPPTGIDATLVQNADGTYTLTSHVTGEKQNFTSGGEPISAQDRNGNTISYAYNAAAQIASITDTQGRVTTFSYNATGFITQVTDPAGRTYLFGYDVNNNMTSYTDPAGKVTYFAYDANHNLTQITDPNGNVTNITYNSSRQVTGITYVTNPSAGTGATTTFTYNSGNTVVTDPNGGTTTYAYDPDGRVTHITDPAGNVSNISWTADSHVSQATDPSGASTYYSYNSLNDLTQVATPTNADTSYQYGDSGHPYSVTAVTNPEGGTATYSYDANGNLTQVVDAAGKTTSYTYNSNGTLASMTDPNGNVTTYQYDSFGNLTKIVYPAPLGSVSYTYDSLSRVTSMTDGKGQTTTYSYDALDRLTQVSYSDGSKITYTYDADGNRTAMTDSTGTTTWAYNALNQTTSKTLPNAQTVTYTWDGLGNLLSKTDSGGTVQYTYTPDNQVDSVTDPNSAKTTLSYNSDGEQTQVAYPNGVTQAMTYNSLGQLTQIQAKNSGGTVLTSYDYSYTNPTTATPTFLRYSMQDTAGNVTAYQYDVLNRLTQANETNNGTTVATYGYTYDPAGNMTSETINGTTTNMTYNTANELTQAGTTTYSYDANGSMTGNSAGMSLSYNAANQTTSITPPGGSADAMGYTGSGQFQRVAEGSNGYQYDATGISSMTTTAGTSYFTRTPDGTLVSERTASGTYYYLFDGLGSVVALTNSSGAVVDSYAYDPYGNITSQTQQVANPFKWIGAVYDPATGLYKMGARYYDPQIARWTQMDPMYAGTLRYPQSLDRYAYSDGSPVTYVDPSGLTWQDLVNGVKYALNWSGGVSLAGAAFRISDPALALGGFAIGLAIYDYHLYFR